MKNVYVTLMGDGNVYQFENLTDKESYNRVPIDDMGLYHLEEDGWLDGNLYEIPVILSNLEVILSTGDEPVWSVDDEGSIDITKKKGKYIKSETYFKDMGFESPFYVNDGGSIRVCEVFKIELEDDEEFDPKKLQLVKSDYELNFLPYGIIVTYIIYNGKVIPWDDPQGYDYDTNQFIYVKQF